MKYHNHRIYDIEALCNLDDNKNIWLLQNTIPRIGRTLVYGHGNTFKTTLVFDLAVAVASGGWLLRQYPIDVHGPVLVVSTESSVYANRDRILRHLRSRDWSSAEKVKRSQPLLPTNDNVKLHFCQQAFDFGEKADCEEFEQIIKDIKPVLIVLDPLDSFNAGDENSAHDTKKFRRFVDHIIEEYQLAAIIIHHATKDVENPSLRGSSAWRGWADAVLFFAKKDYVLNGDQVAGFRVVADKQRDGQTGHIMSVAVTHDNTLQQIVFDPVVETADVEMVGLSHMHKKVYEFLADYGPATQNDIIHKLNSNHKKIRHVLESMQADGLIAPAAVVNVPCGPGGNGTRPAQAWCLTRKSGHTDNAVILLRAVSDDVKDDETYDMDPVAGADDVRSKELLESDTHATGD